MQSNILKLKKYRYFSKSVPYALRILLHHHADCKVQYYWLRRRAIICGKSFDCIKRCEGGKLETVFLKKKNKDYFYEGVASVRFFSGC